MDFGLGVDCGGGSMSGGGGLGLSLSRACGGVPLLTSVVAQWLLLLPARARHPSSGCTHDVQNLTYNIQDDPVTVTIDYIKNTEALGALLLTSINCM